MADALDVLAVIEQAECSTKAIMEAFPEWSDRAFASKFLGNMRSTGLISKRTNGYWTLTKKGRQRLEVSAVAVSEPAKKPDEPEPVKEVVPANTAANESASEPSSFDLVRQLQHAIPNGGTLVIEADEVFLVWRGAQFSIQTQQDMRALSVLSEAYVGEVA